MLCVAAWVWFCLTREFVMVPLARGEPAATSGDDIPDRPIRTNVFLRRSLKTYTVFHLLNLAISHEYVHIQGERVQTTGWK